MKVSFEYVSSIEKILLEKANLGDCMSFMIINDSK